MEGHEQKKIKRWVIKKEMSGSTQAIGKGFSMLYTALKELIFAAVVVFTKITLYLAIWALAAVTLYMIVSGSTSMISKARAGMKKDRESGFISEVVIFKNQSIASVDMMKASPAGH
jgi:hypothetical protein